MKPTKPTDPDHEEIEKIQEVLTDIVRAVVQQPEEVKITSVVVGTLVAFAIKTNQNDVRRVLGKQAKHFKAMQVIVSESLKRLGRETQLAIDEKPDFRAIPSAVKTQSLGTFNAKKFKNVKDVLKQVFSLFVNHPEKLSVAATDISTTMILEVGVLESDYASIYGRPAEFEYGMDGHILGSIKNLFDGIGKNNGRIIRIVVNKL